MSTRFSLKTSNPLYSFEGDLYRMARHAFQKNLNISSPFTIRDIFIRRRFRNALDITLWEISIIEPYHSRAVLLWKEFSKFFKVFGTKVITTFFMLLTFDKYISKSVFVFYLLTHFRPSLTVFQIYDRGLKEF